jgi:hypothetical protein
MGFQSSFERRRRCFYAVGDSVALITAETDAAAAAAAAAAAVLFPRYFQRQNL